MAVTPQNFAYRRYFLTVSNDDIQAAITEVSAAWGGTQQMWDSYDEPTRQQIRDQIMNLLVAWHLADFYPIDLEGIASNGGMPLVMKSMGGVDTKFLPVEVQPALYPLLTNTFGIRAAQMIMSAPDRFGVRGKSGIYLGGVTNPLGV